MAVNKDGQRSTNGSSQHQNGRQPARRGRNTAAPATVRYAHIVGWGMKVPDDKLTNAALEAVVETTDEWIRSHTGIQERRIASDRESVVTLGFEASRAALDRADVLPNTVDLIIVATSTPEDIYPSTACKIQDRLGAINAGAFDLSAACSGFVYALNMASQAIRSGSIDTALVVGAEVNTRVLDWTDRGTCIIFGDGAGAVVLQGRDEPGGVLASVLGSDESGAELLGIPSVGAAQIPEGQQLHKLHMNGREVFRFATRIINDSVREVLGKADLTLDDIALIIPHQANQRIVSAAARTMNVPEDLFYSNIERYGNTSAASIPIALCEAEQEGRLKPNDRIVLVGFGGGLTWGATAIHWQVVPTKKAVGVPYRISRGRREAAYVLAFWRGVALRIFRRVTWFKDDTPALIKTRPVPRSGDKSAGRSDNGTRAPEREKTVEKR